ncbi:hypothetical protein [Streptomyces albidochromogenes]|uniref:hypothetical protein n=1 Tax=Streptomyces albidochromogenes TaxID=329524 RepID=UPI00110FC738|nr:hypothetical protein [Streptomyces albidochromogenes]
MTCRELAAKTRARQASRVSELMRGAGDYPRWECVRSVFLALPAAQDALTEDELRRHWKLGAEEIGKKDEWIRNCLHEEERSLARRRAWGQAVAALVISSLLSLAVPLGHEGQVRESGTDSACQDIRCEDTLRASRRALLARLERYPETVSADAPMLAVAIRDTAVLTHVSWDRTAMRWRAEAGTQVPVACVVRSQDELFLRIDSPQGGLIRYDDAYFTRRPRTTEHCRW